MLIVQTHQVRPPPMPKKSKTPNPVTKILIAKEIPPPGHYCTVPQTPLPTPPAYPDCCRLATLALLRVGSCDPCCLLLEGPGVGVVFTFLAELGVSSSSSSSFTTAASLRLGKGSCSVTAAGGIIALPRPLAGRAFPRPRAVEEARPFAAGALWRAFLIGPGPSVSRSSAPLFRPLGAGWDTGWSSNGLADRVRDLRDLSRDPARRSDGPIPRLARSRLRATLRGPPPRFFGDPVLIGVASVNVKDGPAEELGLSIC